MSTLGDRLTIPAARGRQMEAGPFGLSCSMYNAQLWLLAGPASLSLRLTAHWQPNLDSSISGGSFVPKHRDRQQAVQAVRWLPLCWFWDAVAVCTADLPTGLPRGMLLARQVGELLAFEVCV